MSLRLLQLILVFLDTFIVAFLHPQFHYREKLHRLLQSSTVAPQEIVASQIFLLGLAGRIGTTTTKGNLLLHRHFIWNQRHWWKLLQTTQDSNAHYEIISK